MVRPAFFRVVLIAVPIVALTVELIVELTVVPIVELTVELIAVLIVELIVVPRAGTRGAYAVSRAPARGGAGAADSAGRTVDLRIRPSSRTVFSSPTATGYSTCPRGPRDGPRGETHTAGPAPPGARADSWPEARRRVDPPAARGPRGRFRPGSCASRCAPLNLLHAGLRYISVIAQPINTGGLHT